MSPPPKTSDDGAHEIFAALTAPDAPGALDAPDAEADEPPEPKDPAAIAVACLLEALAAEQTAPFGTPALIILEVPDDVWLDIVMREIRPVLYGVQNPSFKHARKVSTHDELVEIYRGKEFHGAQLDYGLSARIATELLTARSIWIVTVKPEKPYKDLPLEILATAEHQLSLPAFSQDLYDRFLTAVTGEPPAEIWPPAPLTELTPAMLRLAVRPNQSADEYARRIARIISTQRAATPDDDEETSTERRTKLGLKDLHGMPDVIAWAQSLALDLQEYKAGRLNWSEVDRGALLYGPPGTGKTTVARAIAEHCQASFFASSYSNWQGTGTGHLGDVTRAIKEVFGKAPQHAPSVLLIDELDSINSRNNPKIKQDDWWRAVINCLLEQLDGSTQRDGVVVIGATNDPSKIDPAILRSGRLDRQIRVGLPDAASLAAIYRHYLGDSLPDTEFAKLGHITLGRTGADVERIARGARRRARRERREVTFADVFGEIAGTLPPPGDRSLWNTAIHEAGHTVTMAALQPSRLRLVSIFGQGNSAGSTVGLSANGLDMNAAAIDEELVMLLGGRASEEALLGSCSGGSGGHQDSDLAFASFLALSAETCYGLGTTGLLWSDVPEMDELHERFAAQPEAAQAARLRIDRAYERAKALVTSLRRMVEAVAEALLDQYVLTAEQIVPILANCASNADDAVDADNINDNDTNGGDTNDAEAGAVSASNSPA